MEIDGLPIRPEVLRQMRRRSFAAFLAKVVETVSAGDVFDHNWHLDAISWVLGQIELGASKRLLVTMPPRHLKSITISVAWVAWMLGRYPSKKYVCVSYSNDLSEDLAQKCRAVILSDWYRGDFPRTILVGRAPVSKFRTTAGGGRMATSTGGTLTGFGGSTIIIDDPVKPADAMSPVLRQSCIDWYSNTVITRLNRQEEGSIILVMQRIHEEDLAGHVILEGGWDHLNLPALASAPDVVRIGADQFYTRVPGVPLHPSHVGLNALARLQKAMGADNFEAQYQQQPIPSGGRMVKRRWLRYYDAVPATQAGDRIVQSWDTAASEDLSADYSACVTALIRGHIVYVLDVYRARLNFPRLLDRAQQLALTWNVRTLLIEEAVSGRQLLQQLRISRLPGVPEPIGRPATTHKEARMWGQCGLIERGDLLLPTEAPWLASFLHELLGFPRTAKDDQVDALVHLLAWTSEGWNFRTANAGPEIVGEGEDEDYRGPPCDDTEDPWGA